MDRNVSIRQLKIGVPGLDQLLGGGLPEFSFNLIAGTPGSGKTTLAHQIMFALAEPNLRALFFTVLGEPALKMLRYQQQFAFFNFNKIDESIRYVNLSADLLAGDFDRVLARIADEMSDYRPSLVFVDSFHALVQSSRHTDPAAPELREFLQHLSTQMTNWQVTTFLIGDYLATEANASVVLTVADGIVALSQNLVRNSMVRKIQVIKIRGQAQVPGLHTFRIGADGVRVFPRAVLRTNSATQPASLQVSCAGERISMGVLALDAMLGGGLPAGHSLLVVGPSGSGKTILATEFLAEGVRLGEPGVLAAFEKSPRELMGNKKLHKLVQAGQVGLIDTHALDLSIDETLHDLIDMINRMQAKRVVIDSLSGFDLSLAPEFSEDFRSSLYRMIAELTSMGVTILMTSELEDRYTDLRFSPFGSAFLADSIIVQRYVEIGGQFKRALSVVKVRGSAHSKDIRLFDITDDGFAIGECLSGYGGIMTGRPTISPALALPVGGMLL